MLSLIPAASFDAARSTLASEGFSETALLRTSDKDEGVVKGKAPEKETGLSVPWVVARIESSSLLRVIHETPPDGRSDEAEVPNLQIFRSRSSSI
jgi:hypothetical protein